MIWRGGGIFAVRGQPPPPPASEAKRQQLRETVLPIGTCKKIGLGVLEVEPKLKPPVPCSDPRLSRTCGTLLGVASLSFSSTRSRLRGRCRMT